MRNDAKSLEKDLNKPEKVSRWKVTNKQVSSFVQYKPVDVHVVILLVRE